MTTGNLGREPATAGEKGTGCQPWAAAALGMGIKHGAGTQHPVLPASSTLTCCYPVPCPTTTQKEEVSPGCSTALSPVLPFLFSAAIDGGQNEMAWKEPGASELSVSL